ncbi:MAG: diacylglycerol kinase family protein [Patescibacteria group bacterium]|nr:diacylglycerol kinase family protein [Patescibacteria group bacterium]
MYYYIYDGFLADRKHERTVAAIETRLTDLGLSSKIGRLTPFTNAKGLVRDEVRRGAKTIVAVGNDETVAQVVSAIGDADVTLGIIPVGQTTWVARALGIPEGEAACETLSKRVTQMIDLGRVNGQHFLSRVSVPFGHFTVEGEGSFRICPQVADCEMIVSNLRSPDVALCEAGGRLPGDPQDGFLDVLVLTRPSTIGRLTGRGPSQQTVIPLRRLSIHAEEPITVSVDGWKMTNKDFLIEIVPERLKIITGKERLFAAE